MFAIGHSGHRTLAALLGLSAMASPATAAAGGPVQSNGTTGPLVRSEDNLPGQAGFEAGSNLSRHAGWRAPGPRGNLIASQQAHDGVATPAAALRPFDHDGATPSNDGRTDPETAPSDPIIVLGQRRNDASSLLRSGLGPGDVPWSVQVIPASTLEEVRPEAIEDALTLVSNVAFQGDSDGRENAFVLRGFQATAVLRDGFRVETFGGVADPELYNLEALEVIKGPQAVLFGESNPGGLINMRAKRPLNEDHAELVLDYGTDGLISPKVDFGGSIGGSERARYRVVGLYRRDQGWRGYDDPNERLFFAPSLQLAISNNTAITLIGEFTKDDYQADFGTAIDLRGKLTAPIAQVNNHPQDRIFRHQYTFGADVVHSLSDQWYLTARARHFDGGYAFSSLWLPISRNLATNIYTQLALQQEQQNNEEALQLSITGNTAILGRPSNLVAGTDIRQSRIERNTRYDATQLNFLNWADPDYSRPPPAKETLQRVPSLSLGEDINRIGIFARMHNEISDAFSLTVGARFDRIERTPLAGSVTAAQRLSHVSFQAGMLYDISDNASLFASYSESFVPNFVLDRNNSLLAPEKGEGFDIGFRSSDLWNFLYLTIDFFDITKRNVALPDPNAALTDPNPFGYIAAARQTSRGVEVDLEASLTANWKIYGAFGYAHTEDRGLPIVGAPAQTASLRTSYRFDGALRGFTVGGGIRYVGRRLAIADPNGDGDRRDRVFVGSYALLDLFARYDLGDRWRLQLNLRNVTDERYVAAARNNLSRNVYAGAPFEALISLRYRFDERRR